ncbi:MAG: superoxide dismutase [Bacteroidales bacterium]|nr:superoxide dismutase [Bacteroidales bacterium]MDD4384332.1 superoxide dismutase [Bacteroidales bacterium]MDY0198156.1 superoxide dismutase [Tenuifilaceae bacterium]
MKFELPKLNYALDDLSPIISRQTLEFHHGKHHQAYVNNLNNLIQGTKFENADLETIVKEADGGIFNNGAQVWNHTFYFEAFSKNPKAEPMGKLAEAIERDFGSFAKFKEAFTQAAATIFGSGWAWLVKDASGRLEITKESNAGNPLRNGLTPILTCDVWEHAYYLDYQNRRPDYLTSFWKLVDWGIVEKRF